MNRRLRSNQLQNARADEDNTTEDQRLRGTGTKKRGGVALQHRPLLAFATSAACPTLRDHEHIATHVVERKIATSRPKTPPEAHMLRIHRNKEMRALRLNKNT